MDVMGGGYIVCVCVLTILKGDQKSVNKKSSGKKK